MSGDEVRGEIGEGGRTLGEGLKAGVVGERGEAASGAVLVVLRKDGIPLARRERVRGGQEECQPNDQDRNEATHV